MGPAGCGSISAISAESFAYLEERPAVGLSPAGGGFQTEVKPEISIADDRREGERRLVHPGRKPADSR